ncbi:MAG TPA: hypothetical protein VFT45_17105 [Longimicrobium sp.]|nr:hypothetical protein [Longimicrobium sp.]
MADGALPPDEGDFDDALDAEDLEDVLGGLAAPPDETNSGCTVNGNCSCTK